MTNDQFRRFVAVARLRWTDRNGLLVALRRRGEENDALRLCIGPMTNPGLVAESCRVWRGDDEVYNGALDSAELKELLGGEHVCQARFTTSRRPGGCDQAICLGIRCGRCGRCGVPDA